MEKNLSAGSLCVCAAGSESQPYLKTLPKKAGQTLRVSRFPRVENKQHILMGEISEQFQARPACSAIALAMAKGPDSPFKNCRYQVTKTVML